MRRGAVWRRSLIGLSALQALAVLGQAWLAGGFLTGAGGALEAHRNMAFGVIQWIGLFSLVVAILWWRPGRGPAWPIGVTAISLVAIGAQIAVGFADLLQVHIPLGVSIFGLNLWLAAGLSRYERKKR
jgi:hypothetical protein